MNFKVVGRCGGNYKINVFHSLKGENLKMNFVCVIKFS